jgi:O-antigen/teichoic acid export membrane protein
VTDIDPSGPPRAGLLGSGVVVAAGIAVGQVLGYVLLVLGARLLGPATFGELSTLMGLLIIGAVVPLAVQTVAARRVAAAETGADGPTLARLGLVTGAAVTAVGLALVPVAVIALRLDVLPTALVALTLFPLTMSGVGLGREQGAKAFATVGWLYAVLALGRTGFAVIALAVTRSVPATMVAMAVGSVLAWLVVQRRAQLPWSVGRPLPRPMRTETWHTAHALLAMFVFTNADLLLARHSLSAEDAGAYAAGAIVLKVAFWLPQAVAVVVFPRLAEGDRSALVRGVLVIIGLGLTVTVTVLVLGPRLLPVLLGGGYDSVVGQAWLFALAGTAEAVAYLVLFSRLAAQDRLAAVEVWAGVVVLAVTVLTVAHGSPAQIAAAVLAVATALCLVGALAHRPGHVALSPSEPA